MADFEQKGQVFWKWLEDNKATLSNGIAFHDFRSEGAGRGVVATRDIEEGEDLFSIPRSMLLTTQTSELRQLLGEVLDSLTGWNPLILCLMYESQRDTSFWKPYFGKHLILRSCFPCCYSDVLPKSFDTPMFWSQDDLKELDGTDIVEKIGKKEADEAFHREIEPVIKDHPGIFDPQVHTLDLFHQCGSLIMAYSFLDEKEEGEDEQESDMEDDEDEEEKESTAMLAMVPMADMLNHKTGYNNARLFHESECLRMKAIKTIHAGEQVYNTYGDLCNADLLRKYGFVDENNPFDLVELNGASVVEAGLMGDPALRDRKIDLLMEEEALDDCFVIDTECELPPELISTLHVLRAPDAEFQQMERKQKLPKPKMESGVVETAIALLEERLKRYPTSIEASEKIE
ncbi:hypothetical protein BX666DRAFT_1849298 [Dichotomocladium elegans]|nr:hypothetical protein BX666DRAFT_1849298 [Dichotomocladium elegans]